jgi:hypothetical protein
MAAYLENYAKIEYVKTDAALEDRVMARDNYIGIVGQGDDAYILTQGNEPSETVEFARMLKTSL